MGGGGGEGGGGVRLSAELTRKQLPVFPDHVNYSSCYDSQKANLYSLHYFSTAQVLSEDNFANDFPESTTDSA